MLTPELKRHLLAGGCGGDACSHCDGTGRIEEPSATPGVTLHGRCWDCGGTGMRLIAYGEAK